VAKYLSPIADRDCVLGFIGYAASLQFDPAGPHIHAFVQSRAELLVHIDTEPDDFGHQRLEILWKR